MPAAGLALHAMPVVLVPGTNAPEDIAITVQQWLPYMEFKKNRMAVLKLNLLLGRRFNFTLRYLPD
jgi:hypothetical protein